MCSAWNTKVEQLARNDGEVSHAETVITQPNMHFSADSEAFMLLIGRGSLRYFVLLIGFLCDPQLPPHAKSIKFDSKSSSECGSYKINMSPVLSHKVPSMGFLDLGFAHRYQNVTEHPHRFPPRHSKVKNQKFNILF